MRHLPRNINPRRIRSDEDAKAMFENDNEVRRIQDPHFEGSVWDREWENLQPNCQALYLYDPQDPYFTRNRPTS